MDNSKEWSPHYNKNIPFSSRSFSPVLYYISLFQNRENFQNKSQKNLFLVCVAIERRAFEKRSKKFFPCRTVSYSCRIVSYSVVSCFVTTKWRVWGHRKSPLLIHTRVFFQFSDVFFAFEEVDTTSRYQFGVKIDKNIFFFIQEILQLCVKINIIIVLRVFVCLHILVSMTCILFCTEMWIVLSEISEMNLTARVVFLKFNSTILGSCSNFASC